MAYGHAELNLIAASRAIAHTVDVLLGLPELDAEQLQFLRDYGPEQQRLSRTA